MCSNPLLSFQEQFREKFTFATLYAQVTASIHLESGFCNLKMRFSVASNHNLLKGFVNMRNVKTLSKLDLVAVLVIIVASTPTAVSGLKANNTLGGGDCVSGTNDVVCSSVGNNGSSCPGSYTKVTESTSGNYSKKTVRGEAWCASCESTVNKIELNLGCATTAYEVPL